MQRPPRIFSNRLNASEFKRAVWRDGRIVGQPLDDESASNRRMFDDDESAQESDNSRVPAPLDLGHIEMMTTQRAAEALLSDAEDEDAEDAEDPDVEEENPHSECSDDSDEDVPKIVPEKRKDAQFSNGLMQALVGSTINQSEIMDDNYEQFSKRRKRIGAQDEEPECTSCVDDEEEVDDSNSYTTNDNGFDRLDDLTQTAEPVKIDDGACVGCEMGKLIDPVDQFVLANVHRIPKYRLWNLAKDAYQAQVVKPTIAKGGGVLPEWSRNDIERHYEYHVVDQKLFRVSVLQELRGMRALCKQRLVLQSPCGSSEIDKAAMKDYMQLVAMESKEYHMLNSTAPSAEIGSSAKKNDSLR